MIDRADVPGTKFVVILFKAGEVRRAGIRVVSGGSRGARRKAGRCQAEQMRRCERAPWPEALANGLGARSEVHPGGTRKGEPLH